jgi:hypothetical protein
MIEKISAVTLRVANMRASVRFYKDVLGLEILYGSESSYFTSLRTKDGDTILNLEHGNAGIRWGRLIFHVLMLTVSGRTSWKRAFIQTVRRMPRGANVISICPILMAMSFHLFVRSSGLLRTEAHSNDPGQELAGELASGTKFLATGSERRRSTSDVENYRSAELAFAWSFYRQGTSGQSSGGKHALRLTNFWSGRELISPRQDHCPHRSASHSSRVVALLQAH